MPTDFPWASPPGESIRRGEHVETIRLTRSRIVVSYSEPPIPHEMEERLRAYWRDRLDRLVRSILGDMAALSENCYKSRTPPDAPQEPFSGPLARVRPAGSYDTPRGKRR